MFFAKKLLYKPRIRDEPAIDQFNNQNKNI